MLIKDEKTDSNGPTQSQPEKTAHKKRLVWGDDLAFINEQTLREKAFSFFSHKSLERSASLISLASYFMMSLTRHSRQGLRGNIVDVDLTEGFWISRKKLGEQFGKSHKAIEKAELAGRKHGLFKTKEVQGEYRVIAFGEEFINFVTGRAFVKPKESRYKSMYNKRKTVTHLPKVGTPTPPLKVGTTPLLKVGTTPLPKVGTEVTREVINEVNNKGAEAPYDEKDQSMPIKNHPLLDELRAEREAREKAEAKERERVAALERKTANIGVKPCRKKLFSKLKPYFMIDKQFFDFKEIHKLMSWAIDRDKVDELTAYLDRNHGVDKMTVSQWAERCRLTSDEAVARVIQLVERRNEAVTGFIPKEPTIARPVEKTPEKPRKQRYSMGDYMRQINKEILAGKL